MVFKDRPGRPRGPPRSILDVKTEPKWKPKATQKDRQNRFGNLTEHLYKTDPKINPKRTPKGSQNEGENNKKHTTKRRTKWSQK